jgi:Raf kinase inhibitor-like YbhB/YbcL family protein
MTLALASTAFDHHEEIPRKYTCEGHDLSPPLSWSGAPARTRSFALIVEDPDAPDPRAPRMIWVHWVLYNIPADVASLAEDEKRHGIPPGTLQGLNDWKRTGYGGPCPPVGRHRYVHRLYALDVVLPDLHRPDRKALLAAMHGHVLAEAELVGTYEKTRG